MTDDLLSDPDFDPPGKPDFRRVNKGVPMVKDPETGKWLRYRRSSSPGKVLDDESNLNDWQKRTILVGAAQMPEVLAMVSVLDPESDKKAIRDYTEECLKAGKGMARSVQGQAVHAMFDRIDFETDWLPAPQFRALVDAYVQTLEIWGLVPLEGEVNCVNDPRHLAGRLDRRYRTLRNLVAPDGTIIPIGSVVVADTKTGLKLEYAAGSYACQLAAYVDSVKYDVTTDERSPFDPPNYPDWALVVHAVPETKTVELHWVDIQEGRKGLDLVQQVWQWRRQADGLLTPAVPPLRAVPDPPTEPQEPRETAERTDTPHQQPDGSQEPSTAEKQAAVKEWLRSRVLVILEHPEARHQLQRKWPEGVPGLKAEGHDAHQLAALEKVIDQVEADWSLPFGATDPRQSKPEPDWSDKWAKPLVEATDEELMLLDQAVAEHPRSNLLRQWSADALMGRVGQAIVDTYPLAHALLEFGRLGDEWSDDDLTVMLVGTLNAMGHPEGLKELGRLTPEEAPVLMSAAFAIASGSAMLMFDAEDRPVVRFNVKEQP